MRNTFCLQQSAKCRIVPTEHGVVRRERYNDGIHILDQARNRFSQRTGRRSRADHIRAVFFGERGDRIVTANIVACCPSAPRADLRHNDGAARFNRIVERSAVDRGARQEGRADR